MKYVRYRRMTLEEEEAKAKELGIDSPYAMMQKGQIFLDPDIKRSYDNNFMIREEFDEKPEDAE